MRLELIGQNFAEAERVWNQVVQRAIAIQKICEAHGVELGAAALQFPLGHPAVACVIPGARSDKEAAQCAEWMAAEIPPALWAALKDAGHIPAKVATPTAAPTLRASL